MMSTADAVKKNSACVCVNVCLCVCIGNYMYVVHLCFMGQCMVCMADEVSFNAGFVQCVHTMYVWVKLAPVCVVVG